MAVFYWSRFYIGWKAFILLDPAFSFSFISGIWLGFAHSFYFLGQIKIIKAQLPDK